jgi:DNA polymerase III sliding clamp (beta) subunit (PCNA family)
MASGGERALSMVQSYGARVLESDYRAGLNLPARWPVTRPDLKEKESENMSTLERERTLESITVPAADIADLLTGAAIAADKGKSAIDSLAAVYLSATGGTITATASDRYRLIAGEIAGEGELEQTAIRLSDLKAILAAIKSERVSREITFTRAGDSLSVAIGGTSLNVSIGTGKFPPYEHLLESDNVAVESISFNPTFMADFAKVPCSHKGGQLIVTFLGERKPIKVAIQ